MTTVRPTPLPGIILISPITENKVAAWSIANDKQEESVGLVVAIGEPRKETVNGKEIITFPAPQIKVGQKIVYMPEYQKPIEVNGKLYRFIAFEKALGVLPNEK